MLNQRAKILLKTLVERYITEGQPVGSRSLSKFSGLDLSPATIRNVMADLEDIDLDGSCHTTVSSKGFECRNADSRVQVRAEEDGRSLVLPEKSDAGSIGGGMIFGCD